MRNCKFHYFSNVLSQIIRVSLTFLQAWLYLNLQYTQQYSAVQVPNCLYFVFTIHTISGYIWQDNIDYVDQLLFSEMEQSILETLLLLLLSHLKQRCIIPHNNSSMLAVNQQFRKVAYSTMYNINISAYYYQIIHKGNSIQYSQGFFQLFLN